MQDQLVRLTAAKAMANTALRWIPPFLPTLARAFGASVGQMTTAIGLAEMAGLTTVLVGRHLDRGRERTVMVAGLLVVAASAVVALIGTFPAFAVSMVLLILGVANFTVAGHAWISDRVDYRWRARAIGVFETSWAFALLIGSPIVALLINGFGWRAPYTAMAIGCTGAAILVGFTLSPRRQTPLDAESSDENGEAPQSAGTPESPPAPTPEPAPESASEPGWQPTPDGVSPPDPLTAHAWYVAVGSALLAAAGLGVFVISGAWLDDAFGVSTGGLGLIAMTFGAFELAASSATAWFADRTGKRRSTLGGLLVLGVGLAVMVVADDLAVGVIGLLVFLFGFEYGFVTSLSLISEAMPGARGRTLAIGNGIGTVARGSASVASGLLYEAHGIGGTATLSATCAAVATVLFLLSGRGHAAER